MTDAPPTADPEASPSCRNCGERLQGRYCHGCGQEVGTLDRALGPFLMEVFTGLLSFDSRSWRTVGPLFFRPGEVTAEYLRGRRVRYVPPVRLYLFVSLLYFLMLAWLSPQPFVEPAAGVPDAEARQEVEAMLGDLPGILGELPGILEPFLPGITRAAEDPVQFRRGVIQGISYLMFFLVPLFGGMVHLLHLRRRRYFLHHLLFAVHFHAAVFLILGTVLLLDLSDIAWLERGGSLLRAAIPLHLFLSLRRVYGGRFWAILFRTGVLTLGYLVALAALLAGLLVFLLL